MGLERTWKCLIELFHVVSSSQATEAYMLLLCIVITGIEKVVKDMLEKYINNLTLANKFLYEWGFQAWTFNSLGMIWGITFHIVCHKFWTKRTIIFEHMLIHNTYAGDSLVVHNLHHCYVNYFTLFLMQDKELNHRWRG